MRTFRLLRPALRALLVHRTRAALAVAAVAVGITAVFLTSALGRGTREELDRALGPMGARLIVVRPEPVPRTPSRREVQGLAASLRLEDGAAIRALPGIAAAAPAVDASLRVRSPAGVLVAKVVGTGPEFPDVRGFRLAAGRRLDAGDGAARARVAVLGARVSEVLFPDGAPLGRTLRVRGVPFEVVGVFAPRGSTLGGADDDTEVFVPVETALRRLHNTAALSEVYATVADPRDLGPSEEAVRRAVRERHRTARLGRPDDFAVQDQLQAVALQREAARTLGWASAGLAALSLLVGGIGILGLMLLSVAERTPEVGLRMALGARQRDVLVQFLAEAVVLAAVGGAAGVVLGTAGAWAVSAATQWHARASWGAAAVALATSALVGLAAGVLPAVRASRLPPAAALSRG
jgi:putative ABC transport system permease protein